MFTSTEVWGSSYLCSTGWSVCAYLWQLIARTHCLFYLAQKRWHSGYCLSQPGPVGHRPSCRTSGVSVCGHSRGVGCISSHGRIGVNEHFNLLARCQGLLSVITSPYPGDKYGVQWSGAVRGAHLMHGLALRTPDQSLRFDLLRFVTISISQCQGNKMAQFSYRQLSAVGKHGSIGTATASHLLFLSDIVTPNILHISFIRVHLLKCRTRTITKDKQK